MENQTTAPEVQSEQTEAVVQETQTQQPEQTTQTNFQELIPESFKEEKSLQNFKNMEDFVKSYLHSQKLVGANKIPVPNKHATDEDWAEVYNKLGRPETPDGYTYSFKEDEIDQEQLKGFNETAHKLGLLPKQAESLIKYYNEMNSAQSAKAEEQAQVKQMETEEELKKEYGPQFHKRLDQAKKLATNSFGEDFLNNTILKDGSRLGDNLTVIKAFSQLAEKLSEDEIIKGDGSSYLTASEIEKEIAELVEPGSAYWDKNHPNHKRAVDEVYKLRQQLNG
jgi:hypothetical protein